MDNSRSKAAASRRAQLAAKWIVLLAAVALAWPSREVSWGSVVLPSLSPHVAICSTIATRTATVMVLLALPALLLSLFVPRVLCRYSCPVGFLQELLERFRPPLGALLLRMPPIGKWILAATLAGAVLGWPLFLWLDPYAIFNGFMNAWRLPLTAVSLLPAAGLLFILCFDLALPGIWCGRICPLGAAQDLLATPRGWKRRKPEYAGSRRSFLAACAGAAGAFAAQRVCGRSKPMRPPGSLDEFKFSGICIRCGNCTAVCPSRIIRPDLGAHGMANPLTPVLDFSGGYCHETCNRCNEACPSGAIERLPLAEKNRRVIGRAKINLDTCLLANGRECTACIKACPFQALTIDSLDGGFTTQPVLAMAKCTGCGACESVCPVRPLRAILVSSR